jgi:hypothetical protein
MKSLNAAAVRRQAVPKTETLRVTCEIGSITQRLVYKLWHTYWASRDVILQSAAVAFSITANEVLNHCLLATYWDKNLNSTTGAGLVLD